MAQAGERVVIGISPSLTATLNIIAQQQGYFSQQGVDAEIRSFIDVSITADSQLVSGSSFNI
jgi:ABC-type nitrate/sulfonate/bicarbonate transport system substrate-binding protein